MSNGRSMDLDLEKLLAARGTYRTARGLHVVFHEDPRAQSDAMTLWAGSPLGFVFPAKPEPSLLEQIGVIADESAVGLRQSSADDVRELVAPIPYAPALVWVARLLRRLWPVRAEPSGQLVLARDLFGDAPIVGAYERFLESAERGEQRHLFSEQSMHVLARLGGFGETR